jgi:two-component system, cell cycle response regulator DivK
MTPSRRSPRQPRILVADDSEDTREMYAEFLRYLGFTVSTAIDGDDAMAKALTHTPDVLVLDLTMPGLTGWEVAAGLKADARTKHVRIIAVSGHWIPETEEMTPKAGVDAYLVKPCLPEALAEEITRQLREAQ